MKLTRKIKEEISRQVNAETERAIQYMKRMEEFAENPRVTNLVENFIQGAPYLEYKDKKNMTEGLRE